MDRGRQPSCTEVTAKATLQHLKTLTFTRWNSCLVLNLHKSNPSHKERVLTNKASGKTNNRVPEKLKPLHSMNLILIIRVAMLPQSKMTNTLVTKLHNKTINKIIKLTEMNHTPTLTIKAMKSLPRIMGISLIQTTMLNQKITIITLAIKQTLWIHTTNRMIITNPPKMTIITIRNKMKATNLLKTNLMTIMELLTTTQTIRISKINRNKSKPIMIIKLAPRLLI